MTELLRTIMQLRKQRDRARRQLREMRRSRDLWRMRCLGKVKER